MSDAYMGEIRMFGGNYAPQGWAFCDGSVLSIAEFDALFNLIGTTYGGDGQATFALPDLRGRAPVHTGTSASGTAYPLGAAGGSESVTLVAAQIPVHSHPVAASSVIGTASAPAGAVWAASTDLTPYSTAADAQMSPAAITASGGGQSHENRPPFLAVSFIINLYGVWPSPQ